MPSRVLLSVLLVLGTLGSGSCASQGGAGAGETAREETVVLLHGLGRGKMAMWLLASRIEGAGFRVVSVGYDSLSETPEAILREVTAQIDACCETLATPVHFVGHSLGGLMIRAYLAAHRPAKLGRVVLIGTPSYGTPVVDMYQDSWWMRFMGPAAKLLGTSRDSFPASLPDPDYPVGVIAGVASGPFPDDLMPGDHDGLVPVESTKVRGMQDFITVETSHSYLRYSQEVASQVIAFLKTGEFFRAP